MTTKPVKLGLIGCGIAATELHWPALQRLRDKFELVAVCNNSETKAREFSQMAGGIPYFLDCSELLAGPAIEAVAIALPIYLNYQTTKMVLEAGKHVLVEKPIAANLAEAEAMLQLDRRYDLVKMVGENFYYHPVFLKVKRHLENGHIGEPYAAFWDVFRYLDLNSKYAKTKWRIDHKHRGGFVTDGGIHNIAALRLLFGDIVSGQAFTKSINPDIGKMDTLSLQFSTESGVEGVLNLFNSSNGYLRNQLVILGTEGAIQVRNAANIVVTSGGSAQQDEETVANTSYVAEFLDFYSAIREGRTPVSSFRRAFRDFQILLQAYDSSGQAGLFRH